MWKILFIFPKPTSYQSDTWLRWIESSIGFSVLELLLGRRGISEYLSRKLQKDLLKLKKKGEHKYVPSVLGSLPTKSFSLKYCKGGKIEIKMSKGIFTY